jgi:tRNA pseudouridine55 synthase
MNTLLPIYKPVGLTPLQLIQQLRLVKPEYQDETIGYAGRLDPMAQGVMLLMIGKETKNREQYLSLAKEYNFTALLGVETDTYDILGLVKQTKNENLPENVTLIVNNFVNSKIGKQIQKYPPYSSKTVKSKPLFWWAKEGKLAEIELPKHEIEKKNLKLLKTETITLSEVEKRIMSAITLITGDFRQNESRTSWQQVFATSKVPTLTTLTFTMQCSSGTYVRQLVHELGQTLGCGAIALEINRVKLGKYTEADILRI